MDKWKLGLGIFLILSLLIGINFVSAEWTENLNVSLLAYYPTNEISGDMIDILHGHNATCVNTPDQNIDGKIEKGIDFDAGSSEECETTNTSIIFTDLNNSITIGGWYKPDETSSTGSVIGRQADSQGRPRMQLAKAITSWKCGTSEIDLDQKYVTATGHAVAGTWQFVVCIRNATHISVWVNATCYGALAWDGTNIPWSVPINWTFGTRGDPSSAQFYNGSSDEQFIYNRALSNVEIIQMYNGGAGMTYGEEGLTITLLSPDNEATFTTNEINFSANVSDLSVVGIQNVTLEVVYPNGTLFYNETNTSGFEGIYNWTNITIPDGNWNWSVTVYDDANEIYESETRNFSADTAVTLRIVRSDTLALVSDGVMYIDGDYYASNTKTYGEGSLQSMDGQVLEVRAFSLGGFYTENNTNITISSSQQIYNITLEPFKLNLNFYRTNGTVINVSGYITDLNQSLVFTNTSFLKDQGDFQNDLIYIRFIKGIYNYSAYLTWENKSQFYEYDNTLPYSINENITIFNYIDTSSYFQTQDNAGNIIKGAVIRIYGVVPANSTLGTSTYGFFGQRITDDNGRTVFPMDSDMEIYLVVTAGGYQTKTSRLTASEITTFTSSDPFIIRMGRSPYTSKSNVFLSGLYKLEGTRIYESRFNNLSSNYYMFVYDSYLREIKYSTSYEGVNYSISLDGTTRSGVISLLSGEQFSSTDNSTWHLYLWVDNALAYDMLIAYNYKPQEVILDIDLESLADSSAWKVVVFIMIIGASCLIGLLFRTGDDDAGLHTFFIGGFIATLMVNGLGWLALTGGIFYLGKIVKRFFSE